MRIASLCSGYGGLDMAVHAVLGGELAWVADNDPGAAAILAHRFPLVRNFGDITGVNWSLAEPADVLTAGFPCQDVSCAGARKGMRAGTRTGVWSCVAEAIGVLRPSLVLLENVRGLLSAGADSDMEFCPWCLGETGDEHALRAAGAVLGDLADLGFDAEWTTLSASDAGAPHRRERVFILAWPAEDADRATGRERRVPAPGQAEGGRPWADAGGPGGAPAPADAERGDRDGRAGEPVGRPDRRTAAVGDGAGRDRGRAAADADRERLPRNGPAGRREPATPRGGEGTDAPADAERDGRPGRPAGAPGEADEPREGPRAEATGRGPGAPIEWGPYGPAVERWERALGRPAPRPTVPGKTAERLNPVFVEWMQGLPEGWVTGVPGLSRNAMLKALGNGVVPRQAELALRLLLDRAGLAEAGEAA